MYDRYEKNRNRAVNMNSVIIEGKLNAAPTNTTLAELTVDPYLTVLIKLDSSMQTAPDFSDLRANYRIVGYLNSWFDHATKQIRTIVTAIAVQKEV